MPCGLLVSSHCVHVRCACGRPGREGRTFQWFSARKMRIGAQHDGLSLADCASACISLGSTCRAFHIKSDIVEKSESVCELARVSTSDTYFPHSKWFVYDRTHFCVRHHTTTTTTATTVTSLPRPRATSCAGGWLLLFDKPVTDRLGSANDIVQMLKFTPTDAVCAKACAEHSECHSFARSDRSGKCRQYASKLGDPVNMANPETSNKLYYRRSVCRAAATTTTTTTTATATTITTSTSTVYSTSATGLASRTECGGEPLNQFEDEAVADKRAQQEEIIRVLQTVSVAACAQHCTEHTECASFSRSGKSGTCRLQTSTTGSLLLVTKASAKQSTFFRRPMCIPAKTISTAASTLPTTAATTTTTSAAATSTVTTTTSTTVSASSVVAATTTVHSGPSTPASSSSGTMHRRDDIIFILDTSSSIVNPSLGGAVKQFTMMLESVVAIVQALSHLMTAGLVRIALVRFSDTAEAVLSYGSTTALLNTSPGIDAVVSTIK